MIKGQIQLGEVIVIVLHLRAFIGGKAHADQRITDLAVGLCHGVQMSLGHRYLAGLGNVDSFLFKAQFLHLCGYLGLALVQFLLQFLLYSVYQLTHGGTLFFAELAHALEYFGKGAVLAEYGEINGIYRRFVLCAFQAFKGIQPDFFQSFLHGEKSSIIK